MCNFKNTHKKVTVLKKCQPLACNFCKVNTRLGVFFKLL